MNDEQPKRSITGTQKTGFILLLVFAILAVALSLLQIRNTVFAPFVIHLAKKNSDSSIFSSEAVRLQNIDTDHDGLSDYEEIYFYHTSPYLADTDSDGISDKVEIDQGTDPLCPQGETCTSSELPAAKKQIMTSPLAKEGSITPLDVLEKSGLMKQNDNSYSNLLSSLKDPKKLRQMLLNSGQISKEELDKINDKTLLSLTNKLISNNSTSTSSTVNNFSSLNELSNLAQNGVASSTN